MTYVRVVAAVVLFAAAAPAIALALANPASEFCARSGGKTEILKTASGAEFGICILPDGAIVEEWAYYRAHSRPPASSNR